MNLLIIDMQPTFSASRNIIPNVIAEIELAKENHNNIIYLEFLGANYNFYKRTHNELTRLTNTYHYTYGCYKNKDDGSEEVFKLITRFGLGQNFRICGVNTDACVYDTVFGLKNIFENNYIDYKLNVVADAISTCSGIKSEDIDKLYRGIEIV